MIDSIFIQKPAGYQDDTLIYKILDDLEYLQILEPRMKILPE